MDRASTAIPVSTYPTPFMTPWAVPHELTVSVINVMPMSFFMSLLHFYMINNPKRERRNP
jgi:hypothetical protein